MTTKKGPAPDGTVQVDDKGRCLFCGRPPDHVHPEPRPSKRARAKTPDDPEETEVTDG